MCALYKSNSSTATFSAGAWEVQNLGGNLKTSYQMICHHICHIGRVHLSVSANVQTETLPVQLVQSTALKYFIVHLILN